MNNTAQKVTYTKIKIQLLKEGKVVGVRFPKNLRKFPKGVANKIKDGVLQCIVHVDYSNGLDNEIFCSNLEDFLYAQKAFVEEFK